MNNSPAVAPLTGARPRPPPYAPSSIECVIYTRADCRRRRLRATDKASEERINDFGPAVVDVAYEGAFKRERLAAVCLSRRKHPTERESSFAS